MMIRMNYWIILIINVINYYINVLLSPVLSMKSFWYIMPHFHLKVIDPYYIMKVIMNQVEKITMRNIYISILMIFIFT